MRTGVIVAGGRSTRFGDADKAVADLAGTPMVRRVADRIAPVVDELVVNCRADQVDAIDAALEGYPHPVRFAEDDEPDQGPLAGLRRGLAAADGTYAFVVACDMPFVDPELAAHLFSRAAGHDAAVPRLADGYFQPVQAVYRAEPAAAAAAAALERGEGKAIAPLSDLDAVVVEAADLAAFADDSFENLNTRAEVSAAAERLGADAHDRS
ncbi:MAG: molybdenum cofactor guanylyltransferase [Haloarculaceae archaeon]